MRARKVVFASLLAAVSDTAGAQSSRMNTVRIEELTGLKGARDEQEGVFKVTSPRTDVKVNVDGWAMPPFMGVTSWASFKRGQVGKYMVMGDLALFQDEVNPVLSAVLDAGLQVTALHNHFFFDEPKVYFMHIDGEGPQDALAQALRRALDKVKEIRAQTPVPPKGSGRPAPPSPSTITGKAIADLLGHEGTAQDGMYKVVVGRAITGGCGCEIAGTMGVNTWAAFAGSDADAVVDGDFAATEAELQGVLKALRAGGLDVVAIHHHLIEEKPRVLFVHYWGRGKADALARTLKAAMDSQKAK